MKEITRKTIEDASLDQLDQWVVERIIDIVPPAYSPSRNMIHAFSLLEYMRRNAHKVHMIGCVACFEVHGIDADTDEEPYQAYIWSSDACGFTVQEAITRASLIALLEQNDWKCLN